MELVKTFPHLGLSYSWISDTASVLTPVSAWTRLWVLGSSSPSLCALSCISSCLFSSHLSLISHVLQPESLFSNSHPRFAPVQFPDKFSSGILPTTLNQPAVLFILRIFLLWPFDFYLFFFSPPSFSVLPWAPQDCPDAHKEGMNKASHVLRPHYFIALLALPPSEGSCLELCWGCLLAHKHPFIGSSP